MLSTDMNEKELRCLRQAINTTRTVVMHKLDELDRRGAPFRGPLSDISSVSEWRSGLFNRSMQELQELLLADLAYYPDDHKPGATRYVLVWPPAR